MSESTAKLLGNSPAFVRLLHTLRLVAMTDAGVLINGERGVGKTSLAQELHASSQRRMLPFTAINCAGMPDSAFAVRFSTVDGALRGVGGSDLHHGGTLFLDEVGELSAQSQSILFHFLENSAASRQLRLISASSKDLIAQIGNGTFREDLFYRLFVVPLDLPPLRERADDLVLLLKHFSREIAQAYKRPAPRYSVGARNLLKAYSWPGNIRELRNLCERMVILLAGRMIQPENLPEEIRSGAGGDKASLRFALPAEGIDLLKLEGDMIRQALGMTGGNRSKAARLLRLTRDTLLYRIQKHNIEM